MRVNHQHLRAFHAVAQEGSFSRGARRLGMAQPTLSQQIRALEIRHRIALFDGRKQPLELTEAGRRLLELTGPLFAISDEIEALMNANMEGKYASIRLGSDSPSYAARLVARFVEHNPDAGVSVRIGNATEVVQWLRDGLLDAAIGSDPPGDNALHYLPLYCDKLVAAASTLHPMAQQARIALCDLAHETLLLREPSSRTRLSTERLLEATNVTPRRVIEFHTRETIREAIALGLGVSLFYSAECPPDPRIAYLPIEADAPQPKFMGYLICIADQRRTPSLRSLFEAAAELAEFSPLPL
jgi:LysR family transcriptional regulator, low CO2-responsive transcriptional regulator